MPEPRIPAILVLDADETQGKQVFQVLGSQGWQITLETSSDKALARLKAANNNPFHLFITNFKLPKMAGDEILTHARTLSPLTQRMLMVPANESDLVVRAIN